MSEEIEITVVIKVVGPRSPEAVDLIVADIEGLQPHIVGHGDTLSAASIREVRR